jgi:hypothetical protein
MIIRKNLYYQNKDEIMVTENVSNTAEACSEKPKKWDETYKVDFVNNIDVDSIQNLKIHNMFQKINGRNNIINNTTILTSQFTNTFVISNPSIYDK